MNAKKAPPKVELTIPILHDMELAATKTAEVVAKHIGLSEEKTAEISMALIEATINAFEHSESESSNVEIHFMIQGDTLIIKVTDQGKGFDKSKVEIPKSENEDVKCKTAIVHKNLRQIRSFCLIDTIYFSWRSGRKICYQ